MNKNQIRNIVDGFYDFIEAYYILPNELQGLTRVNPIISDLHDSYWYYHIQYNLNLEIYFSKDFANIFLFKLSKKSLDFIESNLNINKDSIFLKEKHRAYNYLYNVELREVSYDFIQQIKEILIQLI